MSDRAPSHAISVREIELQLRGRCESVVRECLPNAQRDGHFLRVGSIAGERGQSLAVTVDGANAGLWTDYSIGAKSPGGSGDLLQMVAATKFGGDLGEAVKWAKSWLGLDQLDPGRLATIRAETAAIDAGAAERAAAEAEAKKRGARALWHAVDRRDGLTIPIAVPLNGTCPASRYLAGRGIDVDRLGKWPGALRYHPEVWNRDAGIKLPCLVSQMITPDGVHVATHRTWLGRDRQGRWVKAEDAGLAVPPRNSKKVLGKSGGAFIPLRKGASRKTMGAIVRPETIYLTEGIEDALTVAMVKPDLRVIAAYSLGNFAAIQFPATIATMVIICDRDDAPPNASQEDREKARRKIEALESAIARQQARGHRVQFVMPPVGVKDINAWLQQDIGERAA